MNESTFVHDQQRVRFQDVDHAGIVFFGKVFEYCHVVYEEFVEQVLGLTPKEFFEDRDLGAPLVATRSEHFRPLYHGDRLVIHARVSQLGTSSMTMQYSVHNGLGELCATVWLKHAFIALSSFQTIPIPPPIRERLTPFVFVENGG